MPLPRRRRQPAMFIRQPASVATTASHAGLFDELRPCPATMAPLMPGNRTENEPPKPQHSSARSSGDQFQTAHVPQQPVRLRQQAQPAQVTGHVVRDPALEAGADVLLAQHVDQEIGQLVRPGRQVSGSRAARRDRRETAPDTPA